MNDELQIRKTNFTVLGALVGAVLGVPLSYYAQPGSIQMKLTLPEYLARLPTVFEKANLDYIFPIILTCVLCALVFGVAGYFVGQSKRSTER